MTMESSPQMLLVEDNPGDARYIQELLREAMAFSERSLTRDGGGVASSDHRQDTEDGASRESDSGQPPSDDGDPPPPLETGDDDFLVHVTRLDDALDHLDDEHVDVVLLDLGLPDSNGLDTLTTLVDAHPTAPVVVLTGLRDREVGIEALRQGAEEYLVKDEINPDLLIRSVYHAIDRKAHEREQARYETLIEESTDANAILDPDGTIQYVTPSVTNVLGYEPDDLADEHVLDFLHPEDREDATAEFEQTVDDPDHRNESEYRFRHADGSWITLHVRSRNLLDDPAIEGIVVYTHDITERNRREHRLEAQHEQLAALDQLNSVVHGVSAAIIDRSTREEIEQTVCEHIAAADSYSFAWIGAVDTATQSVFARAEAGIVDYVESEGVTVESTADDSSDGGPFDRAIQTRSVQIARSLQDDPSFAPLADAAERHDFRSVASIPIVHEDATYGALNVYTERSNAFREEEREVIGHLGELIGHAIAAAERKQALMSDAVVELEFHVADAVDTLGIEQVPTDTIEFHRSIQLPAGEFLVYGVTSPETVSTMEAMTAESGFWKEVSVVSEKQDEIWFELRITDPPLMSDVAALGGSVEYAVLAGSDLSLVVQLPPDVEVRQVVETLQDSYPQAEPVARRQVSADDDTSRRLSRVWAEELTDRQRTVLETAYFSGFFEWPRVASGEEVADRLGVSAPTVSEHLRAAERKIFGGLLDDTGRTVGDTDDHRLEPDQ